MPCPKEAEHGTSKKGKNKNRYQQPQVATTNPDRDQLTERRKRKTFSTSQLAMDSGTETETTETGTETTESSSTWTTTETDSEWEWEDPDLEGLCSEQRSCENTRRNTGREQSDARADDSRGENTNGGLLQSTLDGKLQSPMRKPLEKRRRPMGGNNYRQRAERARAYRHHLNNWAGPRTPAQELIWNFYKGMSLEQ